MRVLLYLVPRILIACLKLVAPLNRCRVFRRVVRFLVDVGRAVHGEALNTCRQRDRAFDFSARALCRVHDLFRRHVEGAVIEGFQPDPDILSFHRLGPSAQNTSARGQNSMRPGVRGIELSVSRERSLIKKRCHPGEVGGLWDSHRPVNSCPTYFCC